MLPLFQFSTPVTNQRLRGLPMAPLGRLWNGADAEHTLYYALALDPQAFHISAFGWGIPHLSSAAKPGNWYEGLWDHDVLEVFLGTEGSGAYQEINLAPNGAWWSMAFDQPRKRSLEVRSGVSTWHELKPSGWEAVLSISRQSLVTPISAHTRVNVCACVGTSDQPQPRKFLSAMTLPGTKPDFHQPGRFVPLYAMECSLR